MCRVLLRLVLLMAAPAWVAATDWPHPRGPQLDGTVAAAGTFDAMGLELAWRVPLGPGYSGIAISDGLVVTGLGDPDGNWIVAFDAGSGREVWRSRLGELYAGHDGSTDGPLSSPVIHEGRVFALDARGDLLAIQLADGKQLWKKALKDETSARQPDFGFGTTPLPISDVIAVQIGGVTGRAIIGLDIATGKTRWSFGDDAIEYQSPTAMTLVGRTQVVSVSERSIVGLDAVSGDVLWYHRLQGKDKTFSATPTFIGDDRFVIPFGGRMTAFRLDKATNGYRLSELYRSPAFGSTYAAPVYHEGHLYGFRGQILTCMNADTGERVWRSRPPGGDGLILIDGQLVIFASGGYVVVADASPAGYNERARLQALGGGSLTWPSFADGKVFVRNLEEIAAVRLGVEAGPNVAEAEPEHTMARWQRRIETAEDPQGVVDELWSAHPRLPIVDGEYLHFLYRGEAKDVAIGGTMVRGETLLPMQRVADTDLFVRTFQLEPGCRWEYRFQIDFEWWEPDGRNPRRVPIAGDDAMASEVMTGNYAPALHLAEPGEAAGRLEKLDLSSPILGAQRKIVVWLPPGYDDTASYPLLVVNGGPGPAWLDKGLLDHTLANLVGDRLPPLVAVFVEPAKEWWHENGGPETDRFVRMLGDELVPMLETRYRLSRERALMGNQMWALSSTLAALRYPQVFDRVGVQSPVVGLGAGPELQRLLTSRAGAESLRFYVDWNRYDLQNIDRGYDLVKQGKAFMSQIRDAGYPVVGGEVLDSYGWSGWRNRSDRLLVALFGD